jgi:hypothetical protein
MAAPPYRHIVDMTNHLTAPAPSTAGHPALAVWHARMAHLPAMAALGVGESAIEC